MNIRSVKLAALRKEYMSQKFDAKDALSSPMAQFKSWFKAASKTCEFEVNAATLATATKSGRPSARQVLLKGIDSGGFIFFTNYSSRKGQELKNNPRAALLFYWPDIERQVRIEGKVELVSAQESDIYFQSRPRGSQLGAWASKQSSPIKSRKDLETQMNYFEKFFQGQKVPRPKTWGGFRLIPERIEFWQGRPNRLHDRILFKREGRSWKRVRLAP